MEKTKKIIIASLGLVSLFALFYSPVFAETNQENVSYLQSLVDLLKQQIEEIKAKIEAFQLQLTETNQVQETAKEAKEIKEGLKETLKLAQQLRKGMRGADVTLLQEFLSTDPEIYPEGLVTGYFGPLTEKAVKKFQKKMGVEQVGVVGPKTLSKVNELLTEGAGSSGKVPPGLLIAPGIRKKITFTPEPLPGQVLPPGIAKKLSPATSTNGTTTPDTTAPLISELISTSTTVSSTKISWLTDEVSGSKVWYSTTTPLDILATSTLEVSSLTLVTSHDLNLSNLNSSTTYYYIVSSSDADSNEATSSEQFFTTLSE